MNMTATVAIGDPLAYSEGTHFGSAAGWQVNTQ